MLLPADVASDTWVNLLRGAKTKKLVALWQTDEKVAEKLSQVYLS